MDRSPQLRRARIRPAVACAGTVAALGLAADQLAKALVGRQLAVGESLDVSGGLSLAHVHNRGIVLGLFPGSSLIALVLGAALVLAALALLHRGSPGLPPAALGLIAAGSSSNLLDRLRLDYVNDFLAPTSWLVCNLGDVFIVLGLAAIFHAHSTAARKRSYRSSGSEIRFLPAPTREP